MGYLGDSSGTSTILFLTTSSKSLVPGNKWYPDRYISLNQLFCLLSFSLLGFGAIITCRHRIPLFLSTELYRECISIK